MRVAVGTVALVLFVGVFTGGSGIPSAWASPTTEGEKTLSPYFFVEGGDPSVDRVPLESTHATVTIGGVIAEVKIRQRYRNEGQKPINARYVFPASTRAAVHGLTMRIGDHLVRAKIQEREQAKKTFEKAKEEGKSATLLEQDRPNVFSMSVANIMPGAVIDIELEYTELLVPTEGTYEFVYPTVVGPRYSNQLADAAPDSDAFVENPYLHEGEPARSTFDIDVSVSTPLPLDGLACSTHETEIEWQGRGAAKIALAEGETDGGNRDYILRYRLAGKRVQSGLMLYEGEEENLFLLMVQPPKRVVTAEIPPREYVFVVDVSGSMNGFPLDVTKVLLRDLIGSLRPTDVFNVVLFAGCADRLAPASLPATAENVDSALRAIDKQEGRGGTELSAALRTALALPRAEHVSRSLIVVTDGFISAEAEAFQLIHENVDDTNVFAFGIGSSVNRLLIEGVARAGLGEPFVATEKDEAKAAARRFRTYVQSPLLTDITFEAQGGFEVYGVVPHAIPDLLAERPLVVCGKWRGSPKGKLRVSGHGGQGPYAQTFDVAKSKPLEANHVLRYLWARSRIATLSDWNFGEPSDEQAREVTTLGLTYNLLTRYTSFVAVLEEVVNEEGDAEDVTQPSPLPKGVGDLAVGNVQTHDTGITSGDEPALWMVLALLALIGAAHLARRVRRA